MRDLVFLLNRRCDDYARDLSDELLLDAVRRAVGQLGRCLDYGCRRNRCCAKAVSTDDWCLGALVCKLVQTAG